ncbi:hypothetical protein K1T71_006534 [Dendrolimus kikuchii]|uniref:Uncharacterized protein n=1 Tax=Dendrolimus kikuchii TaxID=765133 RepID=A0ACC1D136_9NEOP|nr:hypothetical protein K1T71_006534 [Dendrolimus kikuchii]
MDGEVHDITLSNGKQYKMYNGYTFGGPIKCKNVIRYRCTQGCNAKIFISMNDIKLGITYMPPQRSKMSREEWLHKKRVAERLRKQRLKNTPEESIRLEKKRIAERIRMQRIRNDPELYNQWLENKRNRRNRTRLPDYEPFLWPPQTQDTRRTELMNLLISGVTSQINVDNTSDDDVIEVVRDEAPIEILSDDEEAEQNKSMLSHCSVIQNFHFTSLPDSSDNADDKNNFISNLIDPLNSVSQNNIADNMSEVHTDTEFVLPSNICVFKDQTVTNDVNIECNNLIDNVEKPTQNILPPIETGIDLEVPRADNGGSVRDNMIDNETKSDVSVDKPDNANINEKINT